MTDHRFSQCWKLFSTFFRIGAFTFGGGYAMIPLIHREAVEANHWVDDQEILDIIAIAESTPGPIAINSATFIGYKVGGLAGSAAATLGVVLPSFLVISIISLFFTAFMENRWVAWAFEGIRPAVVILILGAVVKMKKSVPTISFISSSWDWSLSWPPPAWSAPFPCWSPLPFAESSASCSSPGRERRVIPRDSVASLL